MVVKSTSGSRRGPFGVQIGNGMCNKTKHPKWVVLEARRLRETHGLQVHQILHKLELRGVEATMSDIERYVNYQSRASLIPVTNRRDPYGPADTGEA